MLVHHDAGDLQLDDAMETMWRMDDSFSFVKWFIQIHVVLIHTRSGILACSAFSLFDSRHKFV